MRFIHILIASIVCVSAQAALADTKTADRLELYYGMAQGDYLIRNYSGAENGLRQILKVNPEHLPALRLQVRIDLEQAETEAALAGVQTILKIAPEDPQNNLLHALVLGRMGARTAAKSVVESVIAETPDNSPHHLAAAKMLGLFQMAESDWDAAADTFYRMYAANPSQQAEQLILATEALTEKAQSALEANDSAAAIKALDDAIALYADQSGQTELQQRSRLRMMQAQIHSRYGQTNDAIRILETQVRQQPDQLDARITLASLYANSGNWEALNSIIEPIKSQAGFADIALYFEGRYAFALGRVGTARTKFEAALEQLSEGLNPLRPTLRFYQGACFEKLNEFDQANAAITDAINTGFQPESSDEIVLAAKICLRTEKYARAIEILEALVLNQEGDHAEAWRLLGRAHQANNQIALALSAYNQALSAEPDSANTLGLRGELLRKVGDLSGAESDLIKALKLSPQQSGLHYALALTYFQQGRLEHAIASLKSSQNSHPNNSDITLLLILLQYTIGDHSSAQNELQHYLKIASSVELSARYIQYLLQAAEDNSAANQHLKQLAEELPDPEFQTFAAFALGRKDIAATLDQAGIAQTPAMARRQICSMAFWIAQVRRVQTVNDEARSLLQIALVNGTDKTPEFQCAQWQINLLEKSEL